MSNTTNNKNDEWRPIYRVGNNNYGGLYAVNKLGQVKSLRNRNVFSGGRKTRDKSGLLDLQKKSASNYLFVNLADPNGKIVSEYVHTLVLTAFVGPRPNGMVACHWNDKRFDNRLSNLRWDTMKNNQADAKFNRYSKTERLPGDQREWEFLEGIEANGWEDQFVELWIKFKSDEAA